jgi:hypothetical protein
MNGRWTEDERRMIYANSGAQNLWPEMSIQKCKCGAGRSVVYCSNHVEGNTMWKGWVARAMIDTG